VINQQVNLFQPTFRKERKLLSFEAMVKTCVAVLILMGGIYGWGEWRAQVIHSSFLSLQNKFEVQTTQLSKVGRGSTPDVSVTRLKQELKELEQALMMHRKKITELGQARDSFDNGVSEYMASFSRQSPKGVWLTGFSVKAGGSALKIQGSALKPGLIPVFLQRLSSEPALEGTRFGLLEIERKGLERDYVDFTVYTGSEIPKEDGL